MTDGERAVQHNRHGPGLAASATPVRLFRHRSLLEQRGHAVQLVVLDCRPKGTPRRAELLQHEEQAVVKRGR